MAPRTLPVAALASLAFLLTVPTPGAGQGALPTGLEVGVLPAVNFDSDDGFGYGVLAALYQYGGGGLAPYEWSLQPEIFLTTEGRRDVKVFFDAPHLLPDGWRMTAFLGTEKHIATPYYGVGNDTRFEETLAADDGPDPFYYRFGRTRDSGTFMLQRPLAASPLRFLVGGGIQRTSITPVPEEDGTTLYALQVGADEEVTWTNFVRGGLVWDTRDRESGPSAGSWTELLVQWVDDGLGADFSYWRWTFISRRYVPLTDRVVFAHRYLVRGISEGAPVYDLYRVQTSFEQQEGLGGSKTVRGLLKNRFVGRGMLVWNAELRWRAADFRLLGRDAHLVLSAFLDQGRVWEGGVRLDELLSDLHRGWGGGARIGLGENFVVALDAGTAEDNGVPIYLGLGYLF